LTVQTQASALLLLGSSERHYTASKLYPALLARRPLLAVYHEASSVVETLRSVAQPPAARWITYGDDDRAESKVDAICRELAAVIEASGSEIEPIEAEALHAYSAQALAGSLAAVFDGVIRRNG
jgi:hypothetical protein